MEIPALAPLILTSNRFLPRDDALLRRFKIVTFSYGEKIPPEKQKEFREKVETRLGVLSEIGKCVAKSVIENPNILDKLDGGILLEKCYESVGLEKPAWLNLEYTETSEVHESILEEFVERFKKYVNDSFARYVSRIIEVDADLGSTTMIAPDKVEIEKKLRILVEKNLLAGVRSINNERIAMTSSLLRELGLEGRIALKSLVEMFGWEYRLVRIGDKVLMGAITEIDKVVELLTSVS